MTATRQDRSTPTPDDAGPVDRLLVELLEHPLEQRMAALQRMAAQHPGHAAELQRRWQWLERFGFADESTESLGTFGPFRLLRRLGGGTADVHLAEDTRTGDQVVVKRLQQAHLLPAAVRNSLHREAIAASRLRHPSIGVVLEFAECDGVPYLVQPFLGDTTLRQWIEQRRAQGRTPSPGDSHLAIEWAEQIARALHAAHACGLVHRDVKPDNIVLQAPGPPVLIDFGLCQEHEPQPDGSPSPAAGTLPYMAPELLSSRDGARGPAADVYALGVTLFEAVTLRLPFHAPSRAALCRLILSGNRAAFDSRMRELPSGLQRVLECAMARDAWERYGTAAAMADDLQRLRRSQRPHAPGTSMPARARRWARRHRVAAMLAALAACAVLVLGWLEWQRAHLVVAASDGRYLLFAERLRGATEAADRLVPGWPERIPALRAWLQEVEGWLAEQERWPPPPASTQAAAPPELRHAIADAAAVHAEFTAPGGPLALVRQRLAWAERVQQVTIDDHASQWRATCDAIARSRHYDGLRLVPQFDLVPLDADPESGLFEFEHVPSRGPGMPPIVRRSVDRKLVRHDFSGIVLVLIPGGEFTMGQQSTDPKAPRFDPKAMRYSAPHRVRLAPFFVSKYEMTSQQWLHCNGDAPSYSLPDLPDGGHRCPVNQVSAEQCDLVLARVGLLLPTEAQWEWAAGRDVPTRWYFGDDPAALPQHGNLDGGDPFPTLAPIGRFAANPSGLHDLYGNVSEWCRDAWMDYRTLPPRAGDGLRSGSNGEHYHRAHRGGGYTCDASVRTSKRYDEPPARRSPTLGARPARSVQSEDRR